MGDHRTTGERIFEAIWLVAIALFAFILVFEQFILPRADARTLNTWVISAQVKEIPLETGTPLQASFTALRVCVNVRVSDKDTKELCYNTSLKSTLQVGDCVKVAWRAKQFFLVIQDYRIESMTKVDQAECKPH